MKLNENSEEYKVYTRLLEDYKDEVLADDEIILLLRDAEGHISNWFYNHDTMDKYYLGDPVVKAASDQNWILLYLIHSEYNNLTEAMVLDVILELEYRLMGSPNIKDLRKELDLTLGELAIKLRIPKRILFRVEEGWEKLPDYVMHSIYVKLIDEVENKRFEKQIEELEEENPGSDFMDLFKDNDEKYNEALEAAITEMLNDSIDNIGKNKKDNLEDEEEMYITPSKSAIDNSYKKTFADLEERVQKKLKDNN